MPPTPAGNALAPSSSIPSRPDDGLGLGLVSGAMVFPLDLFPGTGVAEWHAGGSSVLLNSSWSGTLQSASLDIFSGG